MPTAIKSQPQKKKEKPEVDPAVRAASLAMNAARWSKVPREERVRFNKWVASQGAGRPQSDSKRCPCGAMTLVRARTRAGVEGTSLGHKKGCKFYRVHRLKAPAGSKGVKPS